MSRETEFTKGSGPVRILTFFYLVPLFGMFLFNTLNSLLRTTYFELYKELETAKYEWDNPLILLVCFFLVLLMLIPVNRNFASRVPALRMKIISVALAGVISLFFVLLFRCTAVCDSEALNLIALDFMKGNYETFEQGGYLYSYSFQIGMTAFLELLYRVCGAENFLVFQLLNVIAIMRILWILFGISKELFDNDEILFVQGLLSIGMLPLFLFATFVYGDIIGWAFGADAILSVIRYLKHGKKQDVLKACILLCAGTVIKTNINILVVAAVIALILKAVSEKKASILIWCAALVLISQCGVFLIETTYVKRAGLSEYPSGIPKIAWVAMSMQETDEGGYAPGWYNGYNWVVYERNGYDRKAASEECVQNLKESGSRFLHNKRYTLDFFYKKFTSAWNAPSFQSMITNEWGTRHARPLSPLGSSLIYGHGRDVLYAYMNGYHFILFALSTAGLIALRKKWSLSGAYYLLNIFGGFLFHMIWETQSRYILGYFVLMLVPASCGLFGICGLLDMPGIHAGALMQKGRNMAGVSE